MEQQLTKDEKPLTVAEKVIKRLSIQEKSLSKADMVSFKAPIFNDAFNGGFKNGNLYLICGPPSVGKTTLLVSIAANLSIRRSPNFNVGVITLDITPERWIQRTIANTSDIPLEKISTGILSNEMLMQITNDYYVKCLNELYFNDSCCMNINEIEILISTWIQQHKMNIIFIDAIEFIQPLINELTTKCLADWTRKLKEIATSLNVPIILSTTLNENGEDLPLKQLRKLGAIEENMDVIIFMNRPAFYQSCKGETNFRMLKNNNGSLSFFTLKAMLQNQGFEEIVDEKINETI